MTDRFVVVVFAGVLAAGASAPATASAQEDGAEGRLRIGGFFHMGFGGEGELDAEGSDPLEDDLDPSVGFGLTADVPVIPYFAIGGLIRTVFWESDAEGDRATALDIDVFPRGRYPFERGEVYLAVPAGLSLGWIPDRRIAGIDVEIDTGVGWNVGILAGGQFILDERIGLFGHLGGIFRGTHHEAEAFGGTSDFRVRTRQFVIEIGAAYLL